MRTAALVTYPTTPPEGDHANHHRRILHHGVGRIDQISEPVLARYHFAGYQGKPRDAYRNLQSRKDERHRAWHNHVPKHLPSSCSEAISGANEGHVDRFDPEHRIERRRIKGGEERQEYDGSLRSLEHDDRQRYPGERRDRA